MNTVKNHPAVWSLLFLGLMMLAPKPAQAQATLQTAASASTVTRTGLAELTGNITFTITSGVSVAGRLDITYPVPLINDESTGVSVVGTGGLAGASVTVAAQSGIVIVNIPAGAAAGNSLTVTGVRYSPLSTGVSSISATVSSTGNFITAGQGIASVVTGSADGFALQTVSAPVVSLANGVIVSGPADLIINEGYASSFKNTVGQLGQTAPTQLIFRVIGLPDNVTLTFPAGAVSTSATGATLTATSSVVLTNQSASNLVTYDFAESASSQSAIDSFTITPLVGTTGPPSTGNAYIQVALGPIGVAVPNSNFPSTAIPRFEENYQPSLNSIPGAILTLDFPTSSLATSQNISVSNLGSGGAVLSFRAHRTDGSISTSTLNPALASRETQTFSIPQLFGSSASTASVSSVKVDAVGSRLIGTSIASAQGGLTASAPSIERQQFFLPLSLSATREATMTTVNPGTSTATVSLRLRSSAGDTISSISFDIAGGTTRRDDLLSLFAIPPASLSLNAYIEGMATGSVKTSVFANPTGPVEEIGGLAPSQGRAYRYPFFATGAGYASIVTVVNASAFPVQLQLTPVQNNGSLFPGVNPITQILGPTQRADIDLQTFFSNSNFLMEGSFILNADRADSPNPFSSPLLAGMVRTKTASASAIAPLFVDRNTESYFTSVLENATAYTGIAVTNDAGVDVNATVDVYSTAGVLLGSKTYVVPAQNVVPQLLRDLVPASLGNGEKLIRFTTTIPLGVIVFRGSLNSADLLSLPAQR